MERVTILFDFNNLSMRTLFTKKVKKDQQLNFNMWKYLIMNSIITSLYKFREVKDIVLAIDDFKSWRKLAFSRYKESRKKQRDDFGIDWKEIFDIQNDFIADLSESMPFKVLKVSHAEADDVIAVICREIKGNYIIISNDEDFIQLLSTNVTIYNPSKKKYIEHNDPRHFLLEKCLLGQSKDDIPNVRTPSDFGLTQETKNKRKPGVGTKMADKIINVIGIDNYLKRYNLESNFKRNVILIDFNRIPKLIKQACIREYNSYDLPDPSHFYDFFIRHKMKGFLGDDFIKIERLLLNLYK